MENLNYPYLGRDYVGEEQYVVLFTSQNKGVVVMSDVTDDSVKFGAYDTFDENNFEVLPPEIVVRLNN